MAAVTVVVATFNRIEYLDATLASLARQTFRDYKVLIADDAGSADLTAVKAKWTDERFEFIRRPVNVGMGANIWSGLKAATTPYVAVLNDDDMWEPAFLETMVAALEAHPSVSVAFCDTAHIDAHDAPIPDSADAAARDYGRKALADGLHQPFIYEAVWQRAVPAAVSAVFRYSAIDWNNFPAPVAGYYDEWLAYLAVRDGAAVWYTSQRLSRYRVHGSSETAANGLSTAARLRHRCQDEFISRAKLADPAVRQCHPDLLRRNRWALFGLATVAPLENQRSLARERIKAARQYHPLPMRIAMRALAMAPTWLCRLVLNGKIALSQLRSA